MTVILKSPNGTDLQVNWWNWRPTVSLFGPPLALSDEDMERLQTNGIGASVSVAQAGAISDFLDTYLDTIPEAGRVLLNGSVVTTPKSFALDLIGDSNYSANREWLARFRDFCKVSGGFEVV
jgi:hypothetical protein